MKYIVPILLLIVSVASFVMFTNPTYTDIKDLKLKSEAYDKALTKSLELAKKRDDLTARYNAFPPDEIKRITQLLPDNADNIRLIIDLQRMAQAYGMSVSSTRFDAKSKDKAPATPAAAAVASPLAATGANDVARASKDYGVFDLEFSTTGTYENFLKFLKDVEGALRLTDVESITFSSDVIATPVSTNSSSPLGLGGTSGINLASPAPGGYTYTIKLRTYWLKG